MIDDRQAEWLARHIDLVSFSCDGPPDIHDAQRGRGTSAIVERAIKHYSLHSRNFHIRAIITPGTMAHQSGISDYLATTFNTDVIHFEPVYGSAPHPFKPEDADSFSQAFLKAEEAALKRDCRLELSGLRLGDIHGPHYHHLRGVVHLNSAGQSVNCFFRAETPLESDCRPPAEELLPETFPPPDQPSPLVDNAEGYDRCRDCLNSYHCVRACPDRCPETGHAWSAAADFRCRLNQTLAVAQLTKDQDR